MAEEPIWILPDVVLAIHKRQLAEHGGALGLRDPGLLSSALERPRNTWHYSNPKPDTFFLAKDYAAGLIRNHPFVDGNKRVAFVTCRLFLKLNDYDLMASPVEKYQYFYGLAAGIIGEEEFARWLKERVSRV